MFERKDEKTGRKEEGASERARERENARPKRSDVSGSRRLRTHFSERASSNRRTHACAFTQQRRRRERERKDSFPARSMMHERPEEILSPIPEKPERYS